MLPSEQAQYQKFQKPEHLNMSISEPNWDPEGRPLNDSILLVFQGMTSVQKQNQGYFFY